MSISSVKITSACVCTYSACIAQRCVAGRQAGSNSNSSCNVMQSVRTRAKIIANVYAFPHVYE